MVLVKRALEHKQLNEQASSLRQALSTMTGGASPIFQSSAMKAVVRTVERVAPSDVSLLLTGESGTGKEVIADLVHALSRAQRSDDQGQLRRAAAGVDRKRVVRLGQRRLHRRAGRPGGIVSAVRRRHVVVG